MSETDRLRKQATTAFKELGRGSTYSIGSLQEESAAASKRRDYRTAFELAVQARNLALERCPGTIKHAETAFHLAVSLSNAAYNGLFEATTNPESLELDLLMEYWKAWRTHVNRSGLRNAKYLIASGRDNWRWAISECVRLDDPWLALQIVEDLKAIALNALLSIPSTEQINLEGTGSTGQLSVVDVREAAARIRVELAPYQEKHEAPDLLSLDQIRRVAPPDTLFMHIHGDMGLCIVGTDEGIAQFFLPKVDQRFEAAYMILTHIADFDSETVEVAQRLMGSYLLPPAVANFLKQRRRLVICPDGIFWRLPWGALIVDGIDEHGPCLGQNRALSLIPSINSLLTGKSSDKRREVDNPLFVGAVKDFGNPCDRAKRSISIAGEHLCDLDYSLKEARMVASSYGPEAIVMPDTDFDISKCWDRMSSAGVLHLISHGIEAVDPLDNGIVTHPFDTNAPTANMTARWLTQRKLSARLAFVNACLIGRGERSPGGGLMGLARSIQLAGVQTVVTPSMEVDDYAAYLLAIRFHRYFAEGLPADEAWRRTCAGHSAVKDWAPYILYGDGAVTFPTGVVEQTN